MRAAGSFQRIASKEELTFPKFSVVRSELSKSDGLTMLFFSGHKKRGGCAWEIRDTSASPLSSSLWLGDEGVHVAIRISYDRIPVYNLVDTLQFTNEPTIWELILILLFNYEISMFTR